MKKTFKSVIINVYSILICLDSNAQWQPCNLAVNNNSTGGTAVCVHKNKLYATNNQKGLQVSTDNGATWTVVNSTINSPGVNLYSTDDRLYCTLHNSGCVTIQYSIDDGVTFQLDTAGLPVCFVNAIIHPDASGVSWKNHLMFSFAGPDWEFSRNTINPKWDDANYFDANDCSEFFVKNDTCWAATNGATSNGVAWSVDGLNWTSPLTTSLPNFYVPTQIAWSDNRLFMMGSDVGAGAAGIDTILKYSDDYSLTFKDVNIKQYLQSYAFFSVSGKQPTLNMYTGYDKLFLALGQSVLGSAPDLIVSSDGGQTFSSDTLGFPSAPNTVFQITNIVFLNGWAFAQLNSGDLFRKQLITAANIVASNSDTKVGLYPNPTSGELHFNNVPNNTAYDIIDITGKSVSRGIINNLRITVQHLNNGTYFIKVNTKHGIEIFKFQKGE